jgi:hypothetical protein
MRNIGIMPEMGKYVASYNLLLGGGIQKHSHVEARPWPKASAAASHKCEGPLRQRELDEGNKSDITTHQPIK